MSTVNEKILDSYIRHQTHVLRYAGGLRNKYLKILKGSESGVETALLRYITRVEGRGLYLAGNKELTAKLEAALLEARSPAWRAIYKDLQEEMKAFALAEVTNTTATIEGAVPVVIGLTSPPISQLNKIVNSQPFQGKTLKGWVNATASADVQRMLNAAKVGISQGQTPTVIARNIIGDGVASTNKSIMRKSFNDTEAVLLTLTNGIQQEAKQALYAENADIIKKEIFVATLDARTTLICASNDGKVFKSGEGAMPPLHFRCRSTRVPYFDQELIGNRPFNPTTEKELLKEFALQANIKPVPASVGGLPRGTKGKFNDFSRKRTRELVGSVPSITTYNEWLKGQSAGFQDDVLGPTRADIFRRGDIHLDKFVARDGDTFTLAELEKKGF